MQLHVVVFTVFSVEMSLQRHAYDENVVPCHSDHSDQIIAHLIKLSYLSK